MNTRGLDIPFTRMGVVTSEDLFEDREQPIFDFYEKHRDRYRLVLDIGANIGIHSILMARQGWEVTAYEPDPEHYKRLVSNLHAHGCFAEQVVPINAAVSTLNGFAEFVRVLENGTANHLAGAREAYGDLETVQVRTIDCKGLFAWADFAKIDCEGSEASLLLAVEPECRCEFMVEVGATENAERIFKHFRAKRQMWFQSGQEWRMVTCFGDMPKHYTHGALFIGERP